MWKLKEMSLNCIVSPSTEDLELRPILCEAMKANSSIGRKSENDLDVFTPRLNLVIKSLFLHIYFNFIIQNFSASYCLKPTSHYGASNSLTNSLPLEIIAKYDKKICYLVSLTIWNHAML